MQPADDRDGGANQGQTPHGHTSPWSGGEPPGRQPDGLEAPIFEPSEDEARTTPPLPVDERKGRVGSLGEELS